MAPLLPGHRLAAPGGGKDPFESSVTQGSVWGGITDKGGGNQKLNHEDFQYICFRMFRRLGNNRWGE